VDPQRCRHCDGETVARNSRAAQVERAARGLRRRVAGVVDDVRRAGRRILPRSTVICDAPGGAKRGGEVLCVFAHFDPQGIVDPYVLHYLRALASVGHDVVFVTTSPTFAREQADRVAPLCTRVVHRRNVGFDFASWSAGLEGEDLSARRRVVFANDSVYGPFRGLSAAFDAVESRGLDVWGLTESFECGRHVQSYFLVFERRAIESGFVAGLGDWIGVHADKKRLVDRCEVGLAARAERAGLVIGALWTPDALERVVAGRADFQYRGHPRPLNPTLVFWDVLLADLGFPFLKTDVLKNDRHHSHALRDWRRLVGSAGYDVELIASHLARLGFDVPGPGEGRQVATGSAVCS
jgi:lipopolysaccharide biosynthesis protein